MSLEKQLSWHSRHVPPDVQPLSLSGILFAFHHSEHVWYGKPCSSRTRSDSWYLVQGRCWRGRDTGPNQEGKDLAMRAKRGLIEHVRSGQFGDVHGSEKQQVLEGHRQGKGGEQHNVCFLQILARRKVLHKNTRSHHHRTPSAEPYAAIEAWLSNF